MPTASRPGCGRSIPTVSINSIADMVAQFRLRLSYFRQLSLILGSIALIVTVLLVGTLLAIAVNERIGEIAALACHRHCAPERVAPGLLEGLLLTVVGGTFGVGLGMATARWLDAILTSFPGLAGGDLVLRRRRPTTVDGRGHPAGNRHPRRRVAGVARGEHADCRDLRSEAP